MVLLGAAFDFDFDFDLQECGRLYDSRRPDHGDSPRRFPGRARSTSGALISSMIRGSTRFALFFTSLTLFLVYLFNGFFFFFVL